MYKVIKSHFLVFVRLLLVRMFQSPSIRFHTFKVLYIRYLSTTALTSPNPYDYCIEFVKKNDFDNYLCGLLIPKQYRPHFFAVRAYNVEMAQVKDQANNNPLTARIRFQWWRDVIESAYTGGNTPNEHPVATALHISIRKMKLKRRWIDQILESRQHDIITDQLATLGELETYAEQSHSSVLYLILEMMGIYHEKAEYAASHIGVSAGIVTTLRSIPYHSTQNQIYIPKDIINKHNLMTNIILRGPKTDNDIKALTSAVFDVASQAHGHLDEAKILLPQLPKNAIYALLPAVRSSMHLDLLLKCGFNPYHQKLITVESPLWYQLRLMRFLWFSQL